ncbi:MAG: hypothetical protein LUH07_15845, partial [Lachnospiraceae bacterium]|nr:hypothetical protein [Lachnospiraceae bacterium]
RLCPPLETSRQGNAVPFGYLCQQNAIRPYWMTPNQRVFSLETPIFVILYRLGFYIEFAKNTKRQNIQISKI